MIPARSASEPHLQWVVFTLESKWSPRCRGFSSKHECADALSSTFSAEMFETVALFAEYCRVFGIPVGHPPQNVVFQLPDNALMFDGSAFELDDPRALALSCALLKSYRISDSVLLEFVKAYLEAAKDSHECPPIRDALRGNRLSSVTWRSQSNRVALPCTSWCFSKSFITGVGAASIIATAAVLSNGTLELDLSSCRDLRFIELMPWSNVVNDMRFSGDYVKFGLRGLRLDNCPIRTFGRHPDYVLHGLGWLSFRETKVRNLWAVSSILRDVPSLRAVLISGSARNMNDVNRMRKHLDDHENVANESPKRKTSLRREIAKRKSAGSSSSDESSARIDRSTSRSSSSQSAPKDFVEQEIPYLDISALPNPENLYLAQGACSVPTPATMNPHYRSFVLAHAKPSLTTLDGVAVTKRDVDDAKQYIQHHFDVSIRDATTPPAPISSLLRNREISVSGTQFVHGKPSYRLESTPKRRRNSHYGLPEYATSDFKHRTDQTVGRRFNLQGLRGRFENALLASGGPSSLNSERLLVQDSSFNDRRFEAACSKELLSRTGAPYVEYYCKPGDRPRQFEYNPIDTRLLVYGTEHANLIVLNQETMTVAGSCKVGGGPGLIAPGTSFVEDFHELPEVRPDGIPYQFVGRRRKSVLGLSWFNKDPSMFISGSEDGSIHVYNVDRMADRKHGGCVLDATPFQYLTSLHTNCTDEKFLVSGYSTSIRLYDLGCGLELETIHGCHSEHINVLKFAHRNPNLFVTSSFDKSVKLWDLRERRPGGTRRPVFESESETGNVMVCFSPDDRYMLVSGVDNEVKQYCTGYGRLERSFDIPKSYNEHNYTRSYYMNGGDYIISGSCAEDVVRVYNARTGRLFKEVDLDNRSCRREGLIFVQSLRANPRREFNFSALLSSNEVGPYNILANVSLLQRV